jgi:hypothetical protein
MIGKPLIFLLLLLTTLLCFSLQTGQTQITAQTDTNNFLTYTNHRFTLQYPHGWILNDSDAGFTLHSPDMDARIIVFASTNLSPEAIGMAKNMTLDLLVKSIFLPTQIFSLPGKELASYGINITELNSDGYFLSGHAAGRMVWTYSDNKATKMVGLATLVNNKLYGIVYLAETTKYNNYLHTAQKIMDSFRI